MCNASATGAEFREPTVCGSGPWGRPDYSRHEVRPPVSSYSLTPEQCVAPVEYSLSGTEAFGPGSSGPQALSWSD